jgi:hypothetical protein
MQIAPYQTGTAILSIASPFYFPYAPFAEYLPTFRSYFFGLNLGKTKASMETMENWGLVLSPTSGISSHHFNHKISQNHIGNCRLPSDSIFIFKIH